MKSPTELIATTRKALLESILNARPADQQKFSPYMPACNQIVILKRRIRLWKFKKNQGSSKHVDGTKVKCTYKRENNKPISM